MTVLTDFLPVQKLEEKEVAKQKDYVARLNGFREVVNLMSKTFDCKISKHSEIGQQILSKEDAVYRRFWADAKFIPEEFGQSCLKTKEKYTYLSDLSRYPMVKISELKKIADTLSFVILPIEYVDVVEIFSQYAVNNDMDYSKKIARAFGEFKNTLSECQDYVGKQQLYILAPVTFYNPWKEVSCEKILPKYFSESLQYLSTVLGMVMPTQRNLYKMIKIHENNLNNLNETMKQNFATVEKNINECHRRIDWVAKLVKSLDVRIRSNKEDRMVELREMNMRIASLETMIYCLLDPIIFSVDGSVIISDSNYDEQNARIGLCFGTDMPIDFFVEKGLKTINDKRLKSITHVMYL